jgi:nucleoside-diphosphate-sugar epimerase
MRVLVAGATGAVGRRLVPKLVSAGHQVTATTRSPDKLALLRNAGAQAVLLDGLDAVAVGEAVARAVERTGAGEDFVDAIRRRQVPVIGSGAGVWSFLHVDDAATATVAAVDRGAAGIYNVTDDDPAAAAQWLPEVARVIGAKPPRRIPVWLGRLAAGEAGVSLMTQIRGASNAKARRELDWQPAWGSWRDGFARGLSDAAASARPVAGR